jgi:hypothetical protein
MCFQRGFLADSTEEGVVVKSACLSGGGYALGSKVRLSVLLLKGADMSEHKPGRISRAATGREAWCLILTYH